MAQTMRLGPHARDPMHGPLQGPKGPMQGLKGPMQGAPCKGQNGAL